MTYTPNLLYYVEKGMNQSWDVRYQDLNTGCNSYVAESGFGTKREAVTLARKLNKTSDTPLQRN